ncbi:MltA domain-containing protein, partial [Salmonella enterica subsp. enterica serovar Anatum]|nr:MltA domain-containing protein [Salmonella enterica subsp. enterica serovar Anatum]
EMSIAHIMWFDTGIAAVGFLLALFIGYRSRAESQHHAEAASTLMDNFIMDVQGSGYIDFGDGSPLNFFSYAGKNGWPYRSIGKV